MSGIPLYFSDPHSPPRAPEARKRTRVVDALTIENPLTTDINTPGVLDDLHGGFSHEFFEQFVVKASATAEGAGFVLAARSFAPILVQLATKHKRLLMDVYGSTRSGMMNVSPSAADVGCIIAAFVHNLQGIPACSAYLEVITLLITAMAKLPDGNQNNATRLTLSYLASLLSDGAAPQKQARAKPQSVASTIRT